MDKRKLPRVVAVYWAQPTAEGKARYVVDFSIDLEPGDLDELNALIRQHGGFFGAEGGPVANQATVTLNNADEDYSRLSWLKAQVEAVVHGTVIADLYIEANPVVACLRALGDVRFDDQDAGRIAALTGVASARLVGDVMEVTFERDFAAKVDVAELCGVFLEQYEFVATIVPTLGVSPTTIA